MCREEAQDLCAALAAGDCGSVPVHAIVKEVELEDVPEDEQLGVSEFQTEYFCGTLFQDPERAFYEALGSKPIFGFRSLGKALLNPIKARRELKEMGERMKAKNVEGNMKGDGLTKGGIFVISPGDEILHTFYEDPGKGVPADECAKIVAAVRSIEAPATA